MKKEIGLFEVTMWGVGIILGAGIYVLIGDAAGIAGNSVWLSFIIGAIIASLTGLSYAELSSMFPKEAAEYVYVKIACKCEILAFIIGWLIILTGIISVSTVALGFAGYFFAIFKFPIIPIAIILIVLLSYINFSGIKESSRMNIVFTFVEMFGLILIIIIGIGSFGKVNLIDMPNGLSGILSASALIFFAYLGFEDIVNISEETKNPERIIPKALIFSVIITTLLYVLVATTTVSLANWVDLGNSSAPLAFAASQILGESAFTIMSIIALFATSNTVLIMLVVGSRMIYGMARENALPRLLSKLDKKKGTPSLAILIMMLFSIIFVFFENIEFIASLTSFGAFVVFAFVNLSLIHLRYKEPTLKRTFKVPLNIGKFPIISSLGFISCLFMISQFNIQVILFGSMLVLLGVIIFKLLKSIS